MQASGHHKFVSLIDKLISKIGLDKVVAGYAANDFPSVPEETTNNGITSRAWLASELLCAWEWPGGSALTSFLPVLSAYAKSDKYVSHENFLDSVFHILLDGALVQGGNGSQGQLNLWHALDDKVEIEEPFLRALVSLLIIVFRDNIWQREKAMTLFELLADKIFIGEAINMNCLRILPPIMSVLIRSISSGERTIDVDSDTSEGNQILDTIKSWLNRTLVFPPLISWQTGEGKCYLFLDGMKLSADNTCVWLFFFSFSFFFFSSFSFFLNWTLKNFMRNKILVLRIKPEFNEL